jgi:hypothetical protein
VPVSPPSLSSRFPASEKNPATAAAPSPPPGAVKPIAAVIQKLQKQTAKAPKHHAALKEGEAFLKGLKKKNKAARLKLDRRFLSKLQERLDTIQDLQAASKKAGKVSKEKRLAFKAKQAIAKKLQKVLAKSKALLKKAKKGTLTKQDIQRFKGGKAKARAAAKAAAGKKLKSLADANKLLPAGVKPPKDPRRGNKVSYQSRE